jgi:ATP synthase F1 gamma subunit
MQALPEIKKDIDFNKNLHSLVEVLKSIAVTHYHILERKIKDDENFYKILEHFFTFPELKQAKHPFLVKSERPLGIVAITSDMGLLGGLNMKVMTAAFEEFSKYSAKLIVVGEKGQMSARERGVSFTAFPGVKDDERFGQSLALRDYLTDQVLTGKIGALEVIYPEPISFLAQRIKKYLLLPFAIPEVSAKSGNPNVGLAPVNSIIESNLSDVIEYLVSLWMGQMFYQILGYSRLAELSARYMHLENSAQKLQDLQKKLKLQYFRVRHEIIDRSMREIFAGKVTHVENS